MPEHVLVAFLTGPENDYLYIVLAQFIHYVGDKIEAFLVGQTAHDTDHHLLLVLVKTQLFLQSQLVLDLFLAKILCIVRFDYELVCHRIIFVIVYPVNDTAQVIGSGTEQAVKALTVEGHLDLFRIGIGYRCDGIGKDQASLKEVTVLVCLKLVRCEEIIGKSRKRPHGLNVPDTLELEIVDGHYRLHVPEKLSVMEPLLQEYGNKTRLPVVAVNDIRLKTDHRQYRQHSLGEKDELLKIPEKIPIGLCS